MTPAALRDAKFAGDGDGLAIGVAGQELLVRYGQRRDGIELDALRNFLRYRLRFGFNAGQQNAGAKDPGAMAVPIPVRIASPDCCLPATALVANRTSGWVAVKPDPSPSPHPARCGRDG
jgi:hypothetical protein